MPAQTQTPPLMDLPPSAKLVYTVLVHEGTLTQQELIDETTLPPRTTRDALTRLLEINAIDERIDLSDARKRLYRVIDGPESD